MDHKDEAAWPVGWEGHERAQLLYWAGLPMHVKLAWLEEAQRLVEHLSRQRNPTPHICEDRMDAA